jgi:ABC-type transport system involved in cytochrome c biogenesis permease subunit
MQAPEDWLTTIGFMLTGLVGMLGCGAGMARLRGRGGALALEIQAFSQTAMTILMAIVFIYRQLALNEGRWAPLQSHVDGLSLLICLLGCGLVWARWHGRMTGMGVFILPVLTVLAIWGICASWWTMRDFNIASVWMTAHLVSIYLGSMAVVAAAGASSLWLWVNRLLRSKEHRAEHLAMLGSLGNLESIENAIIGAASAGFVLITFGLITGLVIISGVGTQLGDGWWYSPKMILAFAVWLIYALVMHVKFVPTFRGQRAAWLSILGCILLILALGVAQGLPGPTPDDEITPASQSPNTPPSSTEGAA